MLRWRNRYIGCITHPCCSSDCRYGNWGPDRVHAPEGYDVEGALVVEA